MTQALEEEERELPSHIEAEQSVLGAALISREAVADVLETLKPDNFYRPAHGIILEAMMDLDAEGEIVDAVSVFDRLFKRGDLIRAGGAPYLHTLAATPPTAANVSYYARIVREKWILRRLIESGVRLQAYGYGHEDVDKLVERAQAEVFDITDSRIREDYAPLSAIMPPALDEIEAYGKQRFGGVLTGFKDLDALTHGLHPGQMVIVAARPAVGKSTLGLDFARFAAKRGQTAAVFSLEMSRTDIVTRLLSAECRVNLHKMRAGRLDDEEWTRIARRMSELNEASLFIDDSPQLTMTDIRAKCRRLKQRHDLRLVVVDYLQLMEHGEKSDGRQDEVSKISRHLKLLAKELEVPVVAISQLNRGPEQRTDKRPLISDLRESGSLEQDADVVILLHREDYYDKESPKAGTADLIVAKHRNGPTAIVTVAFQGHYSRFVDMAN